MTKKLNMKHKREDAVNEPFASNLQGNRKFNVRANPLNYKGSVTRTEDGF